MTHPTRPPPTENWNSSTGKARLVPNKKPKVNMFKQFRETLKKQRTSPILDDRSAKEKFFGAHSASSARENHSEPPPPPHNQGTGSLQDPGRAEDAGRATQRKIRFRSGVDLTPRNIEVIAR